MKINEQLIERERRKQIEIQKRKMAPPQLQRVAPIQSAPQRQTRQVEEKKSKKTKRIVNDDSPQMELFSTQPESSSINIDDTSNQLELSLFNKNNDIVLNRIISVEEEMVKIKSSYKNLEKNYEELVDKHGKMLEILQKI
jgi:hypothetical protein